MIKNLYIGQGICIDPFDLATRLGIDLSEEEEEARYFCCKELQKYFWDNPITMSKSEIIIDILTHPYIKENDAWNQNDVVIGIFERVQVSYSVNSNNVENLKSIINFPLDAKKFKKAFGKTPKFMIIRNDDEALSEEESD